MCPAGRPRPPLQSVSCELSAAAHARLPPAHGHAFYKWKELFSFSWWGRSPERSSGAWRQSCFPSRDELGETRWARSLIQGQGQESAKLRGALAPFKIDEDAGLTYRGPLELPAGGWKPRPPLAPSWEALLCCLPSLLSPGSSEAGCATQSWSRGT